MQADMNLCVLSGHVGRDPEMRYTPNGTPVTNFSLAVSGYAKSDDARPAPTWLDIVCWGELAEKANGELEKGARVLLEGRLQSRTWQTQDGQKRSKVEIVAERLRLLGMPSQWHAEADALEQPHSLPQERPA